MSAEEENPLGEGKSRPLSEESVGIEANLRSMFDEPARVNFRWKGRSVSAESWAGQFVLAWSLKQDMFLPSDFVRELSRYFYQELKYWTEWQTGGIAVDGPYKLEGLTALADFFSKETEDNIQSLSLAELEDRPDYIPDDTDLRDGCRFADWNKGFHLALLQFGELNSTNSIFEGLLGEFGTDLDDDFTERYRKLARKVFRERIHDLKCYAKAWDQFYVPVRFFTDQAALDFMQDRHNYKADDLGNFRNVFRRGGSEKKGRGLGGLRPHKPAIITSWEGIRLVRKAAVDHGFDVGETVDAIEQFSGKIVRVD